MRWVPLCQGCTDKKNVAKSLFVFPLGWGDGFGDFNRTVFNFLFENTFEIFWEKAHGKSDNRTLYIVGFKFLV